MLIEILRLFKLTSEDHIRIIRFLLLETQLSVRVEETRGPWFKTTIGTPQGDALSPILFLIYLEHITRVFPPEASSLAYIVYNDDDNILFRESNQQLNPRTCCGL